MAAFDYSKNLTPTSRKIYLRNQKTYLKILGIAALVFAYIYYYFYTHKQTVNGSVQLLVFIPILLLATHRIRVFLRGEMYFQLQRRDAKKGKNEAGEILKSMKGMGKK